MTGIIGFSTKLLPLRVVSENKLKIKWFEQVNEADEIINEAEKLVGKRKKKVWPKLVETTENIFLDVRKRDVFLFALMRYYGFFVIDPFSKYYPLRGKKISLIKTLSELRVEIFSQRFNYSLEETDKAIKSILSPDLAEILNKDIDVLWSDFEENKIFKKIRKKPSVNEITGLINFYYLVVLARLMVNGRFKVKGELPGSALKRIIYVSKTNGIYIDIYREKDSIIILEILPDNEELGSISQQNNISKTIGSILKELIISSLNFTINMSIMLKERGNRKFIFETTSNELLKNMINIGVKTGFWNSEKIDSKWEEEFLLESRKNRFNWKIIADPHVIIQDEIIYVPDFIAIRNNKKVLIEIAGFYTEKYLSKKIEKLKRIEENYHLIVIVPKKNFELFKILNSPVISFKKKIPTQKVLVTLEKMFSNEKEERIATVSVNDILLGKLGKQKVISLKELFKFTNFNHIGELNQWLENNKEKIEQSLNYVVLPKAGLIDKKLLKEICEKFKEVYNNGIDRLETFEQLVISLGISKDWVILLLEKCGFDIVYINFVEVIVKPRGNSSWKK